MFRKNVDLVFTTFQVVAPSLKGPNNGQELLIVGLVVSFSSNYLLREKSNWVSLINFRRGVEIMSFMDHLTH